MGKIDFVNRETTMARKNSKSKAKKYHDFIISKEKQRGEHKEKIVRQKDESDFFNNFKLNINENGEGDEMKEEKKAPKIKRNKIFKEKGRPATFFKERKRRANKKPVDVVSKKNKIDTEN